MIAPQLLLIQLFLVLLPAFAAQQAAALPTAWHIERTSDPKSGARHCALISSFGHVTARLGREPGAEKTSWSVAVGFDNAPGSLRYLRVNRAIYTTAEARFRGAEATEIVTRLKAPGAFAFEWAKRPGSAKQAGLFGTGDFAAKAAQCERWIQGPRA